jgi:hypothetical protein
VSLKQVYDFLYVDVNRIARLVAQLDGRGLLKETVSELTRGAESEATLKIPWLPLRVKGVLSNKRADHYDPSWRLPVLFLDEMQHHIAKSASTWEIGQIVTLTGSIAFRDFAFASQMLKVAAVRDGLVAETAPAARHPKAQSDVFGNAADVLPHMLQALVSDGHVTTWSTLNDACTTASTGDLTLKCGGDIEGLWTLTGILDAKSNPTPGLSRDNEQRGFASEFRRFGEVVRATVGRPPAAFGVTPLTIHRRVEVPDIGG